VSTVSRLSTETRWIGEFVGDESSAALRVRNEFEVALGPNISIVELLMLCSVETPLYMLVKEELCWAVRKHGDRRDLLVARWSKTK
jgi:hypothetical protein